jgi:hypothetical protein
MPSESNANESQPPASPSPSAVANWELLAHQVQTKPGWETLERWLESGLADLEADMPGFQTRNSLQRARRGERSLP